MEAGATTVRVASAPNPSLYGQAVVITATVTGTAPTGFVTITSQGVTCGSPALTGAGNTRTATCTTNVLPVGTVPIKAEYSGDGGNTPDAVIELHQVNAHAPTTTITASPANFTYGEPTTLTAKITGGYQVSGTVAFTLDGTTVAGCAAQPLVSSTDGIAATCTLPLAAGGQHQVGAKYSGDTANLASEHLATIAVAKVRPQFAGVTVENGLAKATLNAVGAGVPPSGQVKFSLRSSTCTAALTASSKTSSSSCSLNLLAPGGAFVDVSYEGDGNYEPVAGSYSLAAALKQPPAGWYWNPAASGRGYFIEILGSRVFFASMLYDVSGRASWVVATGDFTQQGDTFTLNAPLQTFEGGQSLTGAYQAPRSGASPGSMTLQLKADGTGSITWPGETIPIQRFVFNGGTAGAGDPESGWYWNPAEPGRGMAVEVQQGKTFVVMYGYDPAGLPTWYLGDLGRFGGGLYIGRWQQWANGQAIGGAYRQAAVAEVNVGDVVLSFTSSRTATLTLPDSRQIKLERFEQY